MELPQPRGVQTRLDLHDTLLHSLSLLLRRDHNFQSPQKPSSLFGQPVYSGSNMPAIHLRSSFESFTQEEGRGKEKAGERVGETGESEKIESVRSFR